MCFISIVGLSVKKEASQMRTLGTANQPRNVLPFDVGMPEALNKFLPDKAMTKMRVGIIWSSSPSKSCFMNVQATAVS